MLSKSMLWPQLILICAVLMTGCQQESQPEGPQSEGRDLATAQTVDGQRWYTAAQLASGAVLFQSECAMCHGDKAQGLTENWRQRLPDGNFPPPPLNGSAHAWHHPLEQLAQIVNEGGQDYGGQMPAFGEVLSVDEIMTAIAYFQSFWSDETYDDWLDLGGLD